MNDTIRDIVMKATGDDRYVTVEMSTEISLIVKKYSDKYDWKFQDTSIRLIICVFGLLVSQVASFKKLDLDKNPDGYRKEINEIEFSTAVLMGNVLKSLVLRGNPDDNTN